MFFLIVLFGIATFVFFGRVSQARSLNISFRRLCNLYSGILATGSVFRRPYADLWCEGIALQVNCFRQSGLRRFFGGEHMQVEIPWHDHDTLALISPRRGYFNRLFHRRIETGNSHFDRVFMIQSSNPEKTLELVSAGVQAQMDKLRHACLSSDLSVEWSDGRIYIRKRGLITEFELLHHFLLMCVELFRQFELSENSGIEIIGEKLLISPNAVNTAEEDAVCMICGDHIHHGIVYCRTCETPHHLECWKYNGNCSTYGCGETHFITQRRMSRIQRKAEAKRSFG